MQTDCRFIFKRQEFTVTPHRTWARENLFARQNLADRLVVVRSFKGAKIEFADMDGFLGVVSATLATTKMRKERMFIHKSRRVYILVHPTKSRESYKSTLSPSLSENSSELELAPGRSAFRRTGCRGIAGPVPPPLLMECRPILGDCVREVN